jgi:hypothetical protein
VFPTGNAVLVDSGGTHSEIVTNHASALGGLQVGDRVDYLKAAADQSIPLSKTSIPPLSESDQARGVKRGVVSTVRDNGFGDKKVAILYNTDGALVPVLHEGIQTHNLRSGDVVHYTEVSKIGLKTANIESKH